MTAQQDPVRQDHLVANPRVVPHVAVGHVEPKRSENRVLFRPAGSVDGDTLAEHVALADAQSGRFTPVLEVLGRIANHAPRMKTIVRAKRPEAELDALVAAVDNLGIADYGLSLCAKCSEQERHAGADVRA
jgi:hypothetical protein